MGEKECFFNSGVKLKPQYSPDDLAETDYQRDLGNPGQYPFTRGIYAEGYTRRSWRAMQYAGYGVGEDTNARWRFLLSQGQRGLNLAFDLPTQWGIDSDHPRAHGEVGMTGVAVDTLADLEKLYEGIDLAEISTAFTINATANIILAMYVATAERRGVPLEKLRGTLQNDILKEYLSRGMYIFPLEPSIKMVGDTIEYCIQNLPSFNAVSISPHMLSSGATPVQGWAIMFLNAIAYVQEVLDRGYTFDQIAPYITFLATAKMDFLSNIAMFRAARRIWARMCRDRFGAREPRSMMLRVGVGVDMCWLTDRQPLNNIGRIAVMALSAALSGVQSMHLASYDESYAIPSEEATRISLMIQHILAEETNISAVVDPLGGSYCIETLTNELEEAVTRTMAEIDQQGGVVSLIENGQLQRKLAQQAYAEDKAIQTGERVQIGVNKYLIEEDRQSYEAKMFEHDASVPERQIERLRLAKAQRNHGAVERSLGAIREGAERGVNLVPLFIDAVKSGATVGEISDVLRTVYGLFREPVRL